MPQADKHTGQLQAIWVAIVFLALIRLVSIGLYPLMETTEARYGEMGRLMLTSGDWITPWIDYGEPFWGKPPASVWATSTGLSLFGINEFGARFPHWLFGIITAAGTWHLARRRSVEVATMATAILGSSMLFLIASGAVMTDMLMTVGITMTMAGFWLAMEQSGPRLGGSFMLFVGLAVGLLAKGPVAVVLCGLPLGLWTLWNGKLVLVWQRIPWIRGLLFTLLLSVPWYWLAEQRTPGFLEYFLVGEHWKRFTVSGWSGDLYGKAHDFPRGSIWLFALAAFLPWTFLIPAAVYRGRNKSKQQIKSDDAQNARLWKRFLLLWALSPMLFFTMSGNVLITYVLPAAPAIALLASEMMSRRLPHTQSLKTVLSGVIFSSFVMLSSLIYVVVNADQLNSTKMLISYYKSQGDVSIPLYFYGDRRQYSANFYLQRPVTYLLNEEEIDQVAAQRPIQLAIQRRQYNRLSEERQASLKVRAATGDWLLSGVIPK
ncbi:glycosyltransferase family 39 protein [Alcanivorax sp. 1008]|uniref:ArnT family glycosyltransferase n=1 Tax=Alcanivorax sp. 1008 TaxID=2816853 RepID=UPI001D5E07F0|nr:glycosyltransferase family 39 protein [Alcanivorax sp. 1008]MCC1495560.1 glycosyltransferase family 39 protein [Alcanivorax sp. 1008]